MLWLRTRPPTDSTQLARDVEAWLASRPRRALLAALVTLLVSCAATAQLAGALNARGRPFDVFELLTQQLAVWVPWGVLGGPLVYLARWIFRRVRSWTLAGLVQLPMSLAIASGFQLYEDFLAREAFAERWLAPVRASGGLSLRFTRELLVYWLVLAVGAAVHSFLKSQREERRAAELRLRAERLRAALAQARLDTLRSQLHPHFLFNALHSVGALVREGDGQRALQVLSSLGALLRAALDQADAQEVSLEEELRVVERYLAIERVRFGERLRFDVEVDAALGPARVPALLLLPLVENSVRHGISRKPEGGRITIRARRDGVRLVIEVEDDGLGFPREVLDEPALDRDVSGERHIGLANGRRRLALLHGDAQRFEIANVASGGARVTIELPLSEARTERASA